MIHPPRKKRRLSPGRGAPTRWIPALTVTCASLFTSVAWADRSCPGTTDSSNENLYIYGFDVANLSHDVHVYLGNIDFYGASVLAACIEDLTNLTATAYVITDHNDNLLGWLPKYNSHLCSLYHSAGTSVDVVYSSQAKCGVTFNPLNYSGNRLWMYLGGGGDHPHGGSGIDVIYGGSGNDDLDDQGAAPGASVGYVYGEDGNDFCYGGSGQTSLFGGAGDDELTDAGGNGDYLYGEDGNECCMRDTNDNWSVMSGGAGTDYCDTTSGSSCTYSSACSSASPGSVWCVW